MFPNSPSQFHRAFISAPLGLDLGALPALLSERSISWEWAKEHPQRPPSAARAIGDADFLIGVLNGSRGDHRVLYEAGIATGIGRPVLLIMTRSRPLSLERHGFSLAKVSLRKRRALAFHLDLFLKAPRRDLSSFGPNQYTTGALTPKSERALQPFSNQPESMLEREIFDAVEAGGGSAIGQPRSEDFKTYTPDLLVWLGEQDREFLDPAVIEVKQHVELSDMRRLEERLVAFMAATAVRTGLIITVDSPPKRTQQLPNVYWIQAKEFEQLVRSRRLGAYIRDARNRLMHGIG
jgi:hypothetical protein